MNPDQQNDLASARISGYLITPFKEHQVVKTEWCNWCRKNEKSYVSALKSGKSFDVDMDMAGTHLTKDIRLTEEGLSFANDFIERLGLHSTYGSDWVNVKNVPAEKVKILCQVLVYVSDTYKRWSS